MNNLDESTLRKWREGQPRPDLRDRILDSYVAQQTRRTSRRTALVGTVALVAFAAMLLRPVPAEARLATALQRVRDARTVVIHTVRFRPNEAPEPGTTWVAYGCLRRDGLRGIRGLRGMCGRWDYNSKTGRLTGGEKDLRPAEASDYTLSTLKMVDDRPVRDVGEERVAGRPLRRFEEEGCTLWIDEATDRLAQIEERSADGTVDRATFQFDVAVPKEIFAPEALRTPVAANR